MILRIFRNNKPSVYLLLLVYTFAIRGIFLWHPAFEKPEEGAFLSPFIMHWINIHHISLFALQLADIVLIFIEAVALNFVLTANKIFVSYSFVPALVFITLSSLFGEWVVAGTQTIAQFFLILSLMNLFNVTGDEPGREKIFYTSLFLSIGSLFYFPVAFFIPVIIAGILIRSLSFFDFILIIAGFLLPYYFIGIAEYYSGGIDNYLYFLQAHFSINPSPVIDMSIPQEIMLLYFLGMVIWGYMMLRTDREFKILKHRRLVSLVLGYFVISILAGPLMAGSKLVYLQCAVLPGFIFVSKVFSPERVRFYHQLLFLVFLLGAVLFQLDYLGIVRW